jgi:hypothetical protein
VEGGIPGGATAAILVGVWGTFALDVFSTLNSSPQTTELFASDREDSLMHWVYIGSGVAVAGGLYGTILSREIWPLLAAAVVAIGMYYCYVHAVKRGVDTAPPANAED